ncbi:MAG TPA: 16S rRNA (cytosine(967)-C(5))-methyltransferase RsmB, partial [Solirubrobacteraceae bacterium]|nr:16S rRNA (cytosine(967)-C(5))-methyltransferase RsmB [Solirubrobacteraceae bacterium]
MSVAPARAAAYKVIRRVFEQGAYADRALHAAASGLDRRDRALATRLAYGSVQRARTLDYLLGALTSRPPERLEAGVRAALRLGLFQILYLDGVSDYAAVNESVELVKRESPGGAQLVNAVLRRATREGRALLAGLGDDNPARAAVCHSVPDWLAEMWWRELGAQRARALLARVNEPAETALRVNLLRTSAEELAAALRALPDLGGVQAAPAWARQSGLPALPEVLVLEGQFDAFSSPQFGRGELMPQSRASAVVARVLDPQPGERVLDLCAAPGAKTTHIAQLMGAAGEIVAVERNPARARKLARTCELMGCGSVRVLRRDARELVEPGGFRRVLVDPPCSGLGTLQSRPDLRWQPQRAEIEALAAGQAQLLRAGAAQLAPGGTLVYSVCTISRREGDAVIDAFLEQNGEFQADGRWQLLPSEDGTDG